MLTFFALACLAFPGGRHAVGRVKKAKKMGVRAKRILAGWAALGILTLNFGFGCGGAADINPEQCCATNPSCRSESGVDARTCCERESKTLAGMSLQPGPLPGGTAAHIDLAHAPGPDSILAVIPVQAHTNLSDTPLKFPPRDLVKLKTSFLI